MDQCWQYSISWERDWVGANEGQPAFMFCEKLCVLSSAKLDPVLYARFSYALFCCGYDISSCRNHFSMFSTVAGIEKGAIIW